MLYLIKKRQNDQLKILIRGDKVLYGDKVLIFKLSTLKSEFESLTVDLSKVIEINFVGIFIVPI